MPTTASRRRRPSASSASPIAPVLPAPAAALRRQLLAWYDRAGRTLPWRAAPGTVSDPYAVWLSEIMLQQTTVTAVRPYYAAFLARWPTVHALAAAPLDDVLALWAGLGYYARARNLHACARAVVERFDGRFPDTAEGLRSLPGIGEYTAGAIAAIAFNRSVPAVDGNVARVLARLACIDTPATRLRAVVAPLAASLGGRLRPGCVVQALMDLGATVCTPRAPACPACPWRRACRAFATGTPEIWPARPQRQPVPSRRGAIFWLTRATDGAVLVRRRPPQGLLGGMLEFPGTSWLAEPLSAADVRAARPAPARWRKLEGTVRHVFTHFALELDVWAAELPVGADQPAGQWLLPPALEAAGLPTVMRKVAVLAAGAPAGQRIIRRRKSAPKTARPASCGRSETSVR